MLKTISTILLLSICTFAFAQDAAKAAEKNKEVSNAEKFSERSGTLIQKVFEDIGLVKKCEIQLATFTDLISGQSSKAVRFEYEHKSQYSNDTKLALLDADEIEGLIKSIKIIQEKVFPSTTNGNYSEVTFKSRSGFEAGCFVGKNGWSPYMKLEKYDSNSYVFLDKEDFGILLGLLEQVKAKL